MTRHDLKCLLPSNDDEDIVIRVISNKARTVRSVSVHRGETDRNREGVREREGGERERERERGRDGGRQREREREMEREREREGRRETERERERERDGERERERDIVMFDIPVGQVTRTSWSLLFWNCKNNQIILLFSITITEYTRAGELSNTTVSIIIPLPRHVAHTPKS